MPVKKIQPETEKATFEKVAVKPEVRREINILSAMQGKPVYKIVEEMLAVYKAATAGELTDGKPVKLVRALPKGELIVRLPKKNKSH